MVAVRRLQALTGDRIHLWSKKADGWHESELKHRNHADGEKLARLRKGQQAFEKVLELVPDDKDAQQSLAKVQAQVSAVRRPARSLELWPHAPPPRRGPGVCPGVIHPLVCRVP